MFITKRYHDLALKKLALYLKNTQERVLVLDPNYDIFKVDAYPNDYFSVMNGHKRHDDTECAKSRTGFIIMFADFPVLWISKLQNETTLYKMETEIFSLAHFFRELFPILVLLNHLERHLAFQLGIHR